MRLITISGLDGSGKSTQIGLLKSYLESQGKKVFYFHAVQFSLANKISGKSGSGSKSVTKANAPQIFLRKLFLRIDIRRFKRLLEKLKKENFEYVLSDRFFHDSIINICYLENLGTENCKVIGKFKFKIKNSNYLYLAADPERIMSRDRKPDQGLEYLRKKKDLYDRAAAAWEMKTINGNRSKEEIFNEIKNLIQA